ncbi:MAG TPA: NAD(P)-binding domain-containing protein [Bryobacteraceae bacterium]
MSKKIAVLGAGNVGGALARLWSGAGHAVAMGGHGKKNQEAVAGADIVALCVPWNAAREALGESGNLAGKTIVDCTNPVKPDLSGLAIGTTTSAAEQVAEWAHGANVVKAFNTIGAACYGNAQFGKERASGFYCGDNATAKAAVRELIADVGLDPEDVGPLRNARWLEAMAMLWIDLAINQKQGTGHGFRLLRR